jgi:hypothetical protein
MTSRVSGSGAGEAAIGILAATIFDRSARSFPLLQRVRRNAAVPAAVVFTLFRRECLVIPGDRGIRGDCPNSPSLAAQAG